MMEPMMKKLMLAVFFSVFASFAIAGPAAACCDEPCCPSDCC
jgi:hypothetical protein